MSERILQGWILYNREDAKRNAGYIDFYKVEGEKLGIQMHLLYIEDIEFGVQYDEWYMCYQGKEIEKPDFAIVRMNYPLLSRQLELLEIPVFNSSFVASICNDKAQTYQYVAKTGVAMVDSRFVHKNFLLEQLNSISVKYGTSNISAEGGLKL